MELTWGTAEKEAKERHSWRKRSSCIILNRQKQSKKKISFLQFLFYLLFPQHLGALNLEVDRKIVLHHPKTYILKMKLPKPFQDLYKALLNWYLSFFNSQIDLKNIRKFVFYSVNLYLLYLKQKLSYFHFFLLFSVSLFQCL